MAGTAGMTTVWSTAARRRQSRRPMTTRRASLWEKDGRDSVASAASMRCPYSCGTWIDQGRRWRKVLATRDTSLLETGTNQIGLDTISVMEIVSSLLRDC